jgi:response regulator RpfG family c-di-GMP phosphodiesterase
VARRDGRMIGIVDDHPSLRRSRCNLLISVGFRVETFESAEAFLQSAERDEIGCVVLDVRMAGMNGVDLLKHLACFIQRAVKRCSVLAGASPAWGNCRFAPVATEAVKRVTDLLKPSGHRPALGGSASRRAATRVKPEQASKGKS